MDIEREIVATLADSNACLVYQSRAIIEAHFFDKRYAEAYGKAMGYFHTHGRMVDAPPREVLNDLVPDFEEICQEATGAAPSYLADELLKLYAKRQVEQVLNVTLPSIRENPIEATALIRDALGTISSNVSGAEQCIEYGQDMEAYRRMAEARDIRQGAPYPFPEMQAHTGGIKPGEMAILVGPSGKGKAQPYTSNILTDHGWKLMGDIKVGDMVATRRGGFAPVADIFERGLLPVYEVELADGRIVECNDDHLFNVILKSHGRYKEKTVTVREMIDNGFRTGEGGYRWELPLTDAVAFPRVFHVINPYALGVLIGDGALTCDSVIVSSAEPDVMAMLQESLGDEYKVHKSNSENYSWYIRQTVVHHPNPLKREIARLGLNVRSDSRFIPDEYLFDSVENRKALLAGLFDTDGCVMPNGSKTYSTRSEHLAYDVQRLCWSLGYCSRVMRRDRGDKGIDYVVSIITGDRCFRSQKHNCRYDKAIDGRARKHRYAGVKVVDIRDTGRMALMRCIYIDDDEHLYLTDGYTVTHNTQLAVKTALEAVRQGWNVYFATLELEPLAIAQRMEYMEVNNGKQRVSIRDWTSGVRIPQYMSDMQDAQNRIAAMDGRLVIDQPRVQDRTPSALVQACKSHKCNFLIIDQLQFVTKPQRDNMAESVGMVMQEFKQQLMSPADNVRLPMLLLHQMNRVGVKAQEGTGKIGSMSDIAHSSWVEQLADVVWGIGNNREEAASGVMNLATLKSRSFSSVGWRLDWDMDVSFQMGIMHDEAGRPVTLEDW